MPEVKRCAKCGESKPTSEFGKHKGRRDGFFPYCRECKRATDRADHAKHKTTRNANSRRYYQENANALRLAAQRRYRDDPDATLRRVLAWQADNAEKVKRYKAKWVKDNLSGAVRENVRRRYARRKGAFTIRFTTEQLAAKVAYWGHRCWMCGEPFQAIDHVKPLVAGGPHILANLRPICTSCNSRKRATWPLPKGAPVAHSPSKRYENGVLVERAIDTNAPGDPNESEGTTAKPYKTPVPTTRSAEERDTVRQQQDAEAEEKAVQEAENKAVASAETKKPRKRAAKK